jgi:hypothetical protein
MSAFSFLSALRKDAPVAADVHVSTALGGKKPTAKPFAAIIGQIPQDTKLPVTGADLAAQQENPDDAPAKPVGKRGARHSGADRASIQAIHDQACSLGADCDGNQDDVGFMDDVVDQLGKRDGAWSIPFKIAKADADQQLIFGWASVVEKDGKLVIDKQGDVITPEDLEKAAYDFALNARAHGHMHAQTGTGRMVESMVFTKEKQAALGIDLGKVGWWIGFRVDDEGTWAAHKRGELPEFSIGGSGRRVEM